MTGHARIFADRGRKPDARAGESRVRAAFALFCARGPGRLVPKSGAGPAGSLECALFSSRHAPWRPTPPSSRSNCKSATWTGITTPPTRLPWPSIPPRPSSG
ncbi:hypothetical protein [Lysobacter gummosus]|uniref:hypothetical protein n=1 Tax=Lysobacter gummosus TaxID=262324 RepID=UPI00362C388B